MGTPRFKIDTYNDHRWPVALYRSELRARLFRAPAVEWIKMSVWATRDEARKAYDLVKDLPEYLD